MRERDEPLATRWVTWMPALLLVAAVTSGGVLGASQPASERCVEIHVGPVHIVECVDA